MEPASYLPPTSHLGKRLVPSTRSNVLKERSVQVSLLVPNSHQVAQRPERSFSALLFLALAVPSILALALTLLGPAAVFPAVVLSFLLVARVAR